MNVKKSIGFLRECVTRDYGFSHEFINNTRAVMKAAEKQVPQKARVNTVKRPTQIGNLKIGEGVDVCNCSMCNRFISKMDKFCGECGQKLDWS